MDKKNFVVDDALAIPTCASPCGSLNWERRRLLTKREPLVLHVTVVEGHPLCATCDDVVQEAEFGRVSTEKTM
ncbi:hypothetical protein KIN20_036415 [Parelaphostrongylus tenuis]|uniref:Uncharacterized protein n=1 Tax=Parelaphostrongylus tenuis TaxID=148309 RepID=A0AAD5RCS7_PARTN|nr:hypothetical protein KIN20_036415 [Parelaphostrongylus tenuis]